MRKIYAGFLAALMVTGLALSGCGNVQIDGADSKNTTSNTSSSEGTQVAAVTVSYTHLESSVYIY